MKLYQQNLAKHLKQELKPIYLVASDEPLLLQESCDLIRAKAIKQGFSERINWQADNNFNWEELISAQKNNSLFDDKTIIEINLLQKPSNSGRKTLEIYCDNITDDKLLLIKSPKLDSSTQKTKWYQNIDKVGVTIQIWPPDASNFINWLREKLKQNELSCDNDSLKLLASCTENNPSAAGQEIEKLQLLYGKGYLSIKQIKAAIRNNTKFTIFDLADHIITGRIKRSIQIIYKLKQTKVEPILISWAITKQLQELIEIKHAINKGENLSSLYQKFRIWDKRKLIIKYAIESFDIKLLEKALLYCIELDKIIKGVKHKNPWLQIELIARLFSK
ncbi:MAG: DNA polymerase III subunit delta [Gammaproteobacteria bacterium]|nr:DNA polymerase III subunit delta [Gammaproteobacteria bacterium]